MITLIENWIDETLHKYENEKQSCAKYFSEFKDFYPLSFLEDSYFVVTKTIPKPQYPSLREAGLSSFLDLEVEGITYKNVYFLKAGTEESLSLHFHELIHVLQWNYLGTKPFIARYISEIQKFGYRDAPLEEMAYSLENHYLSKGKPINVPNFVKQKI